MIKFEPAVVLLLTSGASDLITIRNSILKRFEVNAIDQFAASLIEELQSQPVNLKLQLTDSELHSVINLGIKRAKTYAIDDQFGVGKFIKLMLLFGLDFDSDPRFPWAKSTLAPTKHRHALFRINDTYAKGVSIARLKPQLVVNQLDLDEISPTTI